MKKKLRSAALKRAAALLLLLVAGPAWGQTGTIVTGTFKTQEQLTPAQAGLKKLATIGTTDVYGRVDFVAVDTAGNLVRELTCGGITYQPQNVRGWIKGDGTLVKNSDQTAGVKVTPNASPPCTPSGTATQATIFFNGTADGRLKPTTTIVLKTVPDQGSVDWASLAPASIAVPAFGYQLETAGAVFNYESWTRFAAGSVPTPASGVDNVFVDTDQGLKAKDSAGAVRSLGGAGDIIDVGNCASGACFQGVTANQVFAGPASGGAAVAAMRALVAADLPLAAAGSVGGIELDGALAGIATAVELAAGVAGAGIELDTSSFPDRLQTASNEVDFLKSGALVCGGGTRGSMKVHTTPLQYCDNAATPALQYAAYGDSAGAATAGDSATGFFSSGTLELVIGGTNQTAWTAGRCVQVNAGGTALESAAAACGSGGSGDNISVNGTAATDADFDDTTPAAATDGLNVKWQKDAGTPNNISAYVLMTSITKLGTIIAGVWNGTAVSVANGGTGATTLTGLLQGNGASAFTAISNSSTVGQVLRVTGASTYAWGALDLADTDAVTGTLVPARLTGTAPADKDVPCGSGSAWILCTMSTPVSVQSGTTYTLVQGDDGKHFVFTNAAAVAVTLTDSLSSGWAVHISREGAATLTLNRQTAGTIDGVTSVTLENQDGAFLTSNGANAYYTERGRLRTVQTADLANDAVTYAKLQNVSATSRLLGRITAGAGDTEELTGTQATTLLDNFTSTLKGLAPSSGGGTTNFLRADGSWAAPPGGGAATWEGLVNTADTATSYVSNNTAEKVTFDFQAAFTTGSQFVIKSSTGNPTGGYLFEIAGHDADVKPFKLSGDGTNGVEMSAAGLLAAIGTGAINATDLICTNCIGPTEITDLALGTDTSGNYVQSVATGLGLAGGAAGSEGAALTLLLSYSETLAGDPALNAKECLFTTTGTSGGGFICEGTTANTNEQLYLFPAVDGADTTSFIATSAAAVTDAIGAATADTLTNKTLDMEGTGNVVTTVSKIFIPAAICQNATATLNWDTLSASPAVPACVTGTNTQKGVADFADSANLSMQMTLALPADFTGNVDAKFKWFTTATSGDVVWQLATICVADAETDDPAYNTASTVTDTAKGTTNQLNDASIASVTITGCAAGELMHLKLFRDSAHASDTLAGTARLVGLELTLRRAQ